MPVNPPKPEPTVTEIAAKAIAKRADLVEFYLGLVTGVILVLLVLALR